MEHFELPLASAPGHHLAVLRADTPAPDVLCGVVASGNLEVLVEVSAQDPAMCIIEIHTAAVGFRETWDAVLQDFASRHAAGGLRFTLNDVGATPAVVALRLAQAFESWCAQRPQAAR